MNQSQQERGGVKPEAAAEEKRHRRRAEEATVVAGLKKAMDGDEQLLAFARGRISGALRSKLIIGPEAFFAPFVNIGMSDRRLVVQHVVADTGTPSNILPHFFPLTDIASISFGDIETFGAEMASRLVVRLQNDQQFRARLKGEANAETAKALVEVFRSLTQGHRRRASPMQRVCAECGHVMDQPFRFCPYCGKAQAPETPQSGVTVVWQSPASANPPSSPEDPGAGSEQAPAQPEPPSDNDFATPSLPSDPEFSAGAVETAPAASADLDSALQGAPPDDPADEAPSPFDVPAVDTPTEIPPADAAAAMPAISAPFGVPSVDSTFIVPTVDAVFAPLAADPATQFVVPEPADPPESAAPGADSDDRVKRLLDTLRQNDEEPPLSAPVRKEPGDGPLKVQVHINRPPIVVNEHLKGADPEEIVSKIKARVLPELGFGARLVIGTMSDLRFAQEIVKRYNDREKQKHPIPASCREFLSLAQSLGFITIE